MSIRAGHHDHFEDSLETVNFRMVNQFSHVGKLVSDGLVCKGGGKK